LAASCASVFNGPEQAQTVAEAHPVSVDSQTVTLTIDVDPTVSDLSEADRSRLRAFADAYLRAGHGSLTITAPSGAQTDFDGQELASDVRIALHDAGVPWEALPGATYRTGGGENGDVLIVSYTRYVATPSECGVWKGLRSNDYRNMRSPNFGCAYQNNIAAMLADPHDLIAPAASSPRDAMNATRAIEAYRSGEDTTSETGDIDASVAQQ
jgi:pilus assembly protein CpaD